MELLVGLIIVLGLVAVAGRFLFRSGRDRAVQLPRIVDDSIGMYALRRMTGRPLGDRRLPPRIPADEGAATARPFNAATAKRLGISRAGDLAPKRAPAAGARTAAGAAAGGAAGTAAAAPAATSTGRTRRLSPVAMGVLAIAAIAVGLALGAGLAVLVPGNGALGSTAGPTVTASPPATRSAPQSALPATP